VDRSATLALARAARRIFVKAGDTIVRLEGPLADADAAKYLVHQDGLLRVPVLVIGDVLVRGYTDALYREALDR
jgi:arsenate reductase-like glutaredoxin family protein